ncbi:TadE/TadG family type IV pilus assembly protein [Chelativorans sp. Marseille-P2723]|uniref:TadE/TadG family type IV pilus assembly protein n=1 Tax=Chelativorans sp. Marseille-P2723 TaxID=2709133 RepID=UPI00156E771E|nr:TadE/TadG family type IV pilus assembly protein [Chelativorans sp. Marseille-P2723]
MDQQSRTGSAVWRLISAGRRLPEDRKGVAALEFALIAPLMLIIYFLAMEFSQAIETDKKVSRMASQIGDLVTQQPFMTPNELKGIMKISDSILQPYARSEPEITVTAIRITESFNPRAEVVWSRRYANGHYSRAEPPDSVTTVPPALMAPGAFLIRAEVNLDYWPVLVLSAEEAGLFGITGRMFPIRMGGRYYLRPRMTHTISCENC